MSDGRINADFGNPHSGMRGSTWVTHEELDQLWSILNGIRSTDEDLLEVTHHGQGIELNVIEANIQAMLQPREDRGPFWVKITSGGPGTSWVGDVYMRGPLADSGATHSGVTVETQPNFGATETGLVGHWFLATRVQLSYTESSESSASSASSETTSAEFDTDQTSTSTSASSSSSSGGDFYVYQIQVPMFL